VWRIRLGARAQQCRHVATATMTCKRHARAGGGEGEEGHDPVTSAANVTDFNVKPFGSFAIFELPALY